MTTMYELIVMIAGNPQNEIEQFLVYFLSIVITCIFFLTMFRVLELIGDYTKGERR